MVIDERQIIFIHPPRSSGTSIEKSLLGKESEYQKHWSATRLRQNIGEDKWNAYFKFGIVRNPFDRVVSVYHAPIFHNVARGISLEQFLMNIPQLPNEDGIQCSDYINEDLDFVIKFETREEDLQTLDKEHGIYIDNNIRLRKTNRKQTYKDYHTSKTIELTKMLFKDDIANFNYKY